jgi:hypothetical protein
MRCRRLWLSLVVPAGALAAVPAAACSVVAGYRPPTNLELAAGADAIVVGEVVGGSAEPGPDSQVVVRPLAAIKGLMPGQDFPLRGMQLGLSDPSDPLELAAPHPEALAGGCIRRTFERGATVLFFLDRADGQWVPADGPFARWAEDVTGDDSPWVELTRFYVRLAQLDDARRTALLEAERDALRVRADEPAAQAIAADLERTLATAPRASPPIPAVAAAPEPPGDGFRDPADITSVQRALDAMRADREER